MYSTADLVAQYLGECRARGLKTSTIRQNQWALARLTDHFPGLPCETEELFIVFDDPGLGPESRQDLRKCLKTFFVWAGERHGLPNPCQGLGRFPRREGLPRVLTIDEVERLIGAGVETRDRILLLTVLDCGLRLSEVASLKRSSILDGWLVVEGKSGVRQVPVSPELCVLLRCLGQGESVWMGRKGPLTLYGVQQVFKRMFSRAGVGGRKVGPHTVRHTFATMYLRSGGGVHQLQRILGHKSVETTMIYVHLAGKDIQADHASHSPTRTLGLLAKEGNRVPKLPDCC